MDFYDEDTPMPTSAGFPGITQEDSNYENETTETEYSGPENEAEYKQQFDEEVLSAGVSEGLSPGRADIWGNDLE